MVCGVIISIEKAIGNKNIPMAFYNLNFQSLHARRYSQSGANCRENRQQELQDKFPSFLFHDCNI